MGYKLLCIDIDGTLVTDDSRIPMQVIESLRNAASRGIKIALVSGRMPAGVYKIERELGIECIKVCNAGTYILMGESCISAQYLPIGVAPYIYREFAEKRKIPLWIFREKDWYVTNIDKFVEREAKIVSYQPTVVEIGQLVDQWTRERKGPNKLLVAADEELTPIVFQEMGTCGSKGFDMARSAATYIEIFPCGVDKGKALHKICEVLDVCVEEAIAIGDQELDIPMIEAAGLGIAMGNAIPELNEKADFVTKTNNEAGIAYALQRYL